MIATHGACLRDGSIELFRVWKSVLVDPGRPLSGARRRLRWVHICSSAPLENKVTKIEEAMAGDAERRVVTFACVGSGTCPHEESVPRSRLDASVVRHTDGHLFRTARVRVTFSRMSVALAVQMKGLGF